MQNTPTKVYDRSLRIGLCKGSYLHSDSEACLCETTALGNLRWQLITPGKTFYVTCRMKFPSEVVGLMVSFSRQLLAIFEVENKHGPNITGLVKGPYPSTSQLHKLRFCVLLHM